MKVTVLGCGRWGTFLAWYSDKIDHSVKLWGRSSSKNLENLIKNRSNEYLEISDSMELTSDLSEAIIHGDVIIISVSAQQLRNLSKKLSNYDLDNKTIILAMKGIEIESGKRLTQIINEEIKQNYKLAIWVGPGHVQAFTKDIPNCMLISSSYIETTKEIIDNFNSSLIRLYKGQDLIGNEVGAAAKNVMGIAAGMLDGLGYSSLKGALMARGSREVARLVRAMGGNELTIYGLSHIGDYEATLFSEFSNNRKFGEDLVLEKAFKKLAEGASTVKAMKLLAEQFDVDLPISEAVYEIIYNDKKAKDVLTGLFMRETKFEF